MRNSIVVWGRDNSVNVQKVLWALEELGLDYTRKDVGGKFGKLDTPEYGAMNPNRLVPVLCDGELVMWESHAIVRYLAATYGAGTLWPEDTVERAIVDQWTDWTATTFQPAWIDLFWAYVRTPPSKQDAALVKKLFKDSVDAFGHLNDRLAKVPYLAGSTLTYADIVAGSALYRWVNMDLDRPAMPHVEAWHQRLLQRPAFVKGTCISYEDLVGREQA